MTAPQTPFVLSLSKERPFFVPQSANSRRKMRCFDKLSTNGFWFKHERELVN